MNILPPMETACRQCSSSKLLAILSGVFDSQTMTRADVRMHAADDPLPIMPLFVSSIQPYRSCPIVRTIYGSK